MAHSIGVLLRRDDLPSPDDLLRLLKEQNLPLTFAADGNLQSHEGWLPMLWRGKDTGCEVSIEKLTKKEARAASKAGYPDLDALLLVETRDWISWQAGSAFAATAAVASHGCISEGEGEYLAHHVALDWARECVDIADREMAREVEAEHARAEAVRTGNIPGLFEAALAGLVGQRLKKLVGIEHILGFATDSACAISSRAWCVIAADGRRIEQLRYASIRDQQDREVRSWAGEPTAEQLARYQALRVCSFEAEELDEKSRAEAMAELGSWPSRPRITDVSLHQPSTIKVSFEHGQAGFEFLCSGPASEVRVRMPPLSFTLGPEGVELA